MQKNMKRSLLAIVLLVHPLTSFACQFDTDCAVGSACEKQSAFSLYGVCMGGMNPGNAYDSQPSYNPMDLNRGLLNQGSDGDARNGMDADGTYGDTCSFNTDCGPGSQCVKGVYDLNGVCI